MINIKQILKYSLFVSLSTFTFSCDSDENEVDTAEGNSHSVLRETEISFFDINEEMTFDVFIEPDASLSSFEVHKDDVKITDGVVGEGTVADNTAIISSSALLPFEFDVLDGDGAVTGTTMIGSFDLTAYSIGANGEQGVTSMSVNVVNPISFTNEVSSVTYGDDAIAENTDAIISFETFTIGATIDDISLFWKNGEEGTYVEDTSKTFTSDGGEIDLKELDYVNYGLVAGDELFYQIVATSGTLTATIETSVILDAQVFGEANIISLVSTALDVEYSLSSGNEVDTASTEMGELTFAAPQGFSTLNEIEFIKLADTGADFYSEYIDVDTAKADFDAGTVITTTQVEAGEIYVYKVIRDDVDYYGTILVGDITSVNAGESINFELTVKENFIIEIE